jgi:hypothetical protein
MPVRRDFGACHERLPAGLAKSTVIATRTIKPALANDQISKTGVRRLGRIEVSRSLMC